MRTILIRITYTLYDTHLAIEVHLLHLEHGRMESKSALYRQNICFRNKNIGTHCTQCAVLIKRDDAVESIISTIELNEYKHTVIVWTLPRQKRKRHCAQLHAIEHHRDGRQRTGS